MSDNRMDNNRVNVTGKICSGFRYSHQIFGEGFYVHIIVVGCDAGSCATYIDEVGRGSVYCCPGTIPEIFKAAIISNATRILLFHNHPGGSLQPSQMDKEFTKNVRKAGELLEIELSDHIIIGRDGAYYSFMEANILDDDPDTDENRS